jgi:SP family myo-inositol transporter-like MFS transporter 13
MVVICRAQNSLMYFSATIFALVGFKSPVLTSLSVAVTNCVFTVVAFAFIDSVGRRRILLWSIPVMVLALAASSVAFAHLPFLFDDDDATKVKAKIREDGAQWPAMILLSLMAYVAAYAVGLGNVPWQQSELFPLSVRAIGSGLATATNWGSNFVVGLTFLPMMVLLTPPWTFAFYATVCAAGWLAVWRIYPETSGLSLEDVGELLKDGWGVDRQQR